MSAPASPSPSGDCPKRPAAGRRRARLIEGGARAGNPQALSLADVQALQNDPSPAARAALACKFGRQYDHLVEGSTKALAEAVLELLVKDEDKKVRQALAEAAAGSANVPQGIARRLARDELDVARPLLTYSPVLTDDEVLTLATGLTSPNGVALYDCSE